MHLICSALEVAPPRGHRIRFEPWSWHFKGDLSIAIARGENGCGKTTFLNVLSGHLKPAKGQAFLNGDQVSGLGPRRATRQGVVRGFQTPLLCDDLSVWQNIALPLLRSGLRRVSRFRAQAISELETVGLASYAEHAPDELSFGQKRMLELARVSAQVRARTTRLVLLDEPFTGLDDRNREAAATMISSLAECAVPIIMVEHDRVAAALRRRCVDVHFYLAPGGSVVINGG